MKTRTTIILSPILCLMTTSAILLTSLPVRAQESSPPVVETNNPVMVNTISAQLAGNLTSLGTASSANLSFEYGINSWNYAFETIPQTSNTSGLFYADLLTLSPDTTYYYRAKAVGDGVGYGNEMSFTTLGIPGPGNNYVHVYFETNHICNIQGDNFTNAEVTGNRTFGTGLQNSIDGTGLPVSNVNLTLDTDTKYDFAWPTPHVSGPPAYQWSLGDIPEQIWEFYQNEGVGFYQDPVSFTPGFDVSRVVDQTSFMASGTQTLAITATSRQALPGLNIHVTVNEDANVNATIVSPTTDEAQGIYLSDDQRQVFIRIENPIVDHPYTYEVTVSIALKTGVTGVEYMPTVGSHWQDVNVGGAADNVSSFSRTVPDVGTWTWTANGIYSWSWHEYPGYRINLNGYSRLLPGYVNGIVTDNTTGLPIGNATVNAYYFNSIQDLYDSTQTSSDGTYILSLPAGQYRMQVSADGKATEYYQDTYYAWGPDTKPVIVTTGDTTPGINFSLEPGVAVSGDVTDTNGLPISGALVIAQFSTGFGGNIEVAYTAVDGTYRLTGLPLGTYKISALGVGTHIRQYHNGKYFVSQADDIIINNDIDDMNFTLISGSGILFGSVYQTDGKTIITDASIEIYTLDGDNWVLAYYSPSTSFGWYIEPSVKPGTYRIHASAPGFVDQWYNGADSMDEATQITVSIGSFIDNINFKLYTVGGSISGFVTDNTTGLPITNLHVFATDNTTGAWISSANTDENGYYTIHDLMPGSYRIKAVPSITGLPYAEEYFDNIYSSWLANLVIVTGTADTLGIDFSLSPGGNISGTVIDTVTGTPAVNVSVQCGRVNEQGKYWWVTTTDSQGNYTIVGLPVGTYIVRSPDGIKWSSGDDNYISEYYSGKLGESLANTVTVTEGNTTTDIDFTLEVGGSISGCVTDNSTGLPITNLHVFTTDYYTNAWISGSNTDGNGYYTIRGLPSGDYRVRASPAATGQPYADEQFDNVYSYNYAQKVTVTGTADTPDINFSLSPGGSISGRVMNADGLAGLPNVSVDFRLSNESGSWWWWVPTDNQGYYSIHGLPIGSYIVRAPADIMWSPGDDNYISEYYIEKLGESLANTVTVTEGNTTTGIDFTLEIGGSISGCVTDNATGLPIANLHVFATDYNTGAWISGTNTNSEGYYIIHGLTPGDYRIRASPTNSGLPYADEFFDNSYFYNFAKKITVTGNSDTPDIDFSLTQSGFVSGIVTDKDSNLLSGANVAAYVYNAFGGPIVSTQTNNNGVYTLNLPPGQYNIQASSTGKANQYYPGAYYIGPDTLPVTVVVGETTNNINFSLEPGAVVSGRVTDTDGNPINQTFVYAQYSEGYAASVGMGITATNGTYKITGLPLGNYKISATNVTIGNYIRRYYDDKDFFSQADVVVVNGDIVINDIKLTTGAGLLTGIVYEVDGNTAIPYASVEVYVQEGDNWILAHSFLSTFSGAYFMSNRLKPGTYRIHASAPGFVDQWYNGADSMDEATQITISPGSSLVDVNFKLNREYETPMGTDIEVNDPFSGVSVTFDNVTSDGVTSIIVSEEKPAPAEGFNFLDTYYDVVTDAAYSGNIILTMTYDAADIPEGLAEEDLCLYHWTGSVWEDVTTALDVINNKITGVVTSLSWFAVGTPTTVPSSIYNYAVVALNGDLVMALNAKTVSDPCSPVEGDVYAQGNISLSGNAIINGDATATGGISTLANARITGTRTVNLNPPLAFTTIDTAAYLAEANAGQPDLVMLKTQAQSNPAKKYTGSYTAANGDKLGDGGKYSWITGDLTIGGNSVVQLSGILWVGGKITISGNAAFKGTGTIVSESTNVKAIYVTNNGQLKANGGDMQVVAAAGGIKADGNGGVVARIYAPNGDINFSGNNNVMTLGPMHSTKSLIISANTQVVMAGTVWFDGTITMTGNSGLQGPGVIVAMGNVRITGNASTKPTVSLPLVISTDGGMELALNSWLGAVAYVPNGSIRISGNGKVYGSVAGKSVMITDNAQVVYPVALRE